MWALADQFAVSAGNFLTQLILARVLAPASYGVFAVLCATILFLNGLHGAIILFPIYQRCGNRAPSEAAGAATVGLALTPIVGLVLAVPTAIACVVVGRPDLILVTVLAQISWQAQETVRAALLAQLRQRDAILGDAISYLGQATIVTFLGALSILDLHYAFLAICLTSVLATAVQMRVVGYRRLTWSEVNEFWILSRRVGSLGVPAKLISFFTIQAFPWALELGTGAASAAAFQAMANILGAINPILIGTGSLVTASVANDRTAPAMRRARGHALFGALAVMPWLVFVAVAPSLALQLFYGPHSPYLSIVWPTRIAVLSPLLEALALPITCVMTGLGNMRQFLLMQSIGAVGFILLSPLIPRFGVAGAAVTMVIVQLARAAYGLRYFDRLTRCASQQQPTALRDVANA